MKKESKIIVKYSDFLRRQNPAKYRQFCASTNSDEARKGEAATYNFLCTLSNDVEVNEDIATGGADFKCTINNNLYFIETTSISNDSFMRHSGLPNDGERPYQYSYLTPKLRTIICGKANQLSGYESPRILVITSVHRDASHILGYRGVDFLMTSETRFGFDFNSKTDKSSQLITDLRDSIFFRICNENSELEYARRSISAVLLISNYNSAIGLLHPKPIYNLSISDFPDIPFLEITSTDELERGTINTQWKAYSSLDNQSVTLERPIKSKEVKFY